MEEIEVLSCDPRQVAPGMLLLSFPCDKEQTYRRAALLVVEHSDQGSVALQVHAPTTTTVAQEFPEWSEWVASPSVVFAGGKQDRSTAHMLVFTKIDVDLENHPHLQRLANRIGYVRLPVQPTDVQDAMRVGRIFTGCTKWEPGALEAEIAADRWLLAPCLPQDVFSDTDVWGNALRRQQGLLALFSTHPGCLVDWN